MGFPEFVIVIASIMALNPIAMDMMLPALPDIASAFHITAANRSQMVLSIFLLGFGVGQFVMGPLSDRFGRRPLLLGGMTIYCIASLLAIAAPSFETLLLARALQGLGTSATRVIATSIVRDCYSGRRMASVVSLAMMVFIAVPVVAPAFGQAVLMLTQWRGIFVVLMLYGVVALIWSALRMPETLPVERRRSLAIGAVFDAFRQTVTNRQTLGYALAAGGVLGSLFAFVFITRDEYKTLPDVAEGFSFATGNFPEPMSFSWRAFGALRDRRAEFDLVHDNQTLGWGLLALKYQGWPILSTIHHPISVDRRPDQS